MYGRTTVTALSDVYPGCPVAGFDDGEVVDVFDEYGEPYARLSVGWALESVSTGEQVEIFVAPS